MKIRFLKSLAVAFAMLVGGTAMAQDYYELEDSSVQPVSAETSIEQASFMGGGYDDVCDTGCCGARGGAYVDLELLLFQAGTDEYYNPEADENLCFDYEFVPRISVGYVGCGGLGIRARYFDFSHNAGVDFDHFANFGDENVLIDTYNLDLEFFEEIEIGCATSVEWSAGVRYNDFRYRYARAGGNDVEIDNGPQAAPPVAVVYDQRFSGFGLIFGLQANRCLGPGNIYGRARWAILHADSNSYTDTYQGEGTEVDRYDYCDGFRMQTEIALGYEVSRCTNLGVVTGRLGYEMQFWENFVSPYNLGFHGLVLGLELAR